jgi:prevent-host-death family protein
MITHVTLPEATANIAQLLERVINGEEIIIFQAGQPIARIFPAKSDLVTEHPPDQRIDPFNIDNSVLNPNLVSTFNLADLLYTNYQPSEEIQIFQNNQSIARLIIEPRKTRQPRKPGSAIGTLTIVVEDDEHLDAFSDYTKIPLIDS